jgi:hypothetical protein
MMTVGHDPPAALSDWTIDVLTGRRRHFPKRRMTEAATNKKIVETVQRLESSLNK